MSALTRVFGRTRRLVVGNPVGFSVDEGRNGIELPLAVDDRSQPPSKPRESAPDQVTLRSDLLVSIVIPAYNEANRLPETLPRVMTYLRSAPFGWELILVDDGSTDITRNLFEAVATEHAVRCGIDIVRSRTRIVKILSEPHRGKASAVRAGMMAATGEVAMFSDADLSTPLQTMEQMLAKLKTCGGTADVVIGSREGLRARRRNEPVYRHIMGRAFNRLVQLLVLPGIRDSQCGFKLFTSAAAHDLFRRLRLYGDDAPIIRGPMVTGFDVELLFLAQQLGYRVEEWPVAWQHVGGSKVDPMQDAWRMLLDIIRVRLNYHKRVYQ